MCFFGLYTIVFAGLAGSCHWDFLFGNGCPCGVTSSSPQHSPRQVFFVQRDIPSLAIHKFLELALALTKVNQGSDMLLSEAGFMHIGAFTISLLLQQLVLLLYSREQFLRRAFGWVMRKEGSRPDLGMHSFSILDLWDAAPLDLSCPKLSSRLWLFCSLAIYDNATLHGEWKNKLTASSSRRAFLFWFRCSYSSM